MQTKKSLPQENEKNYAYEMVFSCIPDYSHFNAHV